MANWLLEDIPRERVAPRDYRPTVGPNPGLDEIIGQAYTEQYRVNSMYGISSEFRDRVKKTHIADSTFPVLPKFTDSDLRDIARYYENGVSLDMSQSQVNNRSLKQRFDDYQAATGGGMDRAWADTKTSIQDIVAKGHSISERASWGKNLLGGFLGGAFGSFSERDPWNVVTIGVGGVGKTALARIGSEIGANSVIEGVNMLTGVTEMRQLAGVPMSGQEVLADIALTGLAAGAMRGLFVELPTGGFRDRRTPLTETPSPASPISVEQYGPTAPGGGTGPFRTRDGFGITGEMSPVQRASVDTPGASWTEVTGRRVEIQYALDYLEASRAPPLTRSAVVRDYLQIVRAFDDAITSGEFSKPGATLESVFTSLKTTLPDGSIASPFRPFTSTLTEADINVALRDANPQLFAQRAQTQARLDKLSDKIDQMAPLAEPMERVQKYADNQRLIAQQEALLESGFYKKKRQIDQVKADIKRLRIENEVVLRNQKTIDDMNVRQAADNLMKRIDDLTNAVGQIDSQIAAKRQAILDDQAARAARVPKAQVAVKLQELADFHEKALPKMGEEADALAAQVALKAKDDVIDFGDLKNVPLDMPFFALKDDGTFEATTLHDALRALVKDNNLEAAMKECNIG